MTEEDKNNQSSLRVVPRSTLDFSLMTTESVWGRAQVPIELKNKLQKYYLEIGKKEPTKESLWGLLGFYTRDVRLGNLSKWDELPYCRYLLDLAGDLLQADMIEAFLIALSRVATVLELSQSKGGFLRREMNTFRQAQKFTEEKEPPKKSLFGAQNKNAREY